MSTFDNQLLQSVLSGSMPDDKIRGTPKIGEMGGSAPVEQEGDSRHAMDDSENPLSALNLLFLILSSNLSLATSTLLTMEQSSV